MNEPPDLIKSHLAEGAALQKRTADACAGDIREAVHLISSRLKVGSKLLLCGNGGSAADCQHMAAEFVGRLSKDLERDAIPAIALTTDTSFLTAYGNDFGDDGVFSRQVGALGNKGDVLILISTSGKSRNILRAAEEANRKGILTVSLTGHSGLDSTPASVEIRIPSDDTQHVQEVHVAVEHIICRLVELELYGK